MKSMRKFFSRSDKNTVTFGDPADPHTIKTVRVRKITIAKARDLMDSVGSLPALILSVVNAPPDERFAYLYGTIQQSLNDMARLISTLTELDVEYVENNVSVDQMVEYISLMIEYNDINGIVKNVQRGLNVLKGGNPPSQTADQSEK